MTPEELEQKRKTYQALQLGFYALIPMTMGILTFTWEPPWIGFAIGAALGIGDVILLRILKKSMGLDGTPTSSQSQADEKQSEQL